MSILYNYFNDTDILNIEIENKIKNITTEKNKFGEVFTPVKMILELLEQFPKRVWKNKTYKWLDPASGIGNFHIYVYIKLMSGLKNKFPSKIKRHNHIIKNMLYFIEIQEDSVNLCRSLFGKKINIFCGDFLENKWKTQFKVNEFDIIVGNPPYQT